MSISEALANRLTVPLIAAPMTEVSGPDLVIAACREGVVGSLPTHNAATTGELDHWLTRIETALSEVPRPAPFAPNLVVHRSNRRLREDLACLVDHGVELVITSVGSPEPVIAPLRGIGCQVYADVASLQHAERAIALGVDGLVLLTAGAGGQTGWANPFSFVRAVRERFNGTIVLAGGISDGVALHAAQVLGADLGYMGTKFIATEESQADSAYRRALVEASLDDVVLSTQVGGIPASLLKCWVDRQAGDAAAHPASEGFRQDRLLSNRTAWSGGHSVSGVDAVLSVAALIEKTAREYEESRAGSVVRDNSSVQPVT
ncbi:nitronate monooxygenase [Rhodococcus sp. USK13]|uniref:NAD(P)H-dependent flavin oxidoreductase n=1 Tax=Rhodococcus sp. USK13 TaxID=2806442 RepID=UPI001BCB9E74|nr:nitronate monooxygenase [Rhodococcus sp. USK13]